MKKIFLLLVLSLFSVSCFPKSEANKVLESAALKGADNCKLVGRCGDLAAIDCGATVDGFLYYINTNKDKLVMCCGGCCNTSVRKGTQCSKCPPEEWKCN